MILDLERNWLKNMMMIATDDVIVEVERNIKTVVFTEN
jgi:hypothetical protein